MTPQRPLEALYFQDDNKHGLEDRRGQGMFYVTLLVWFIIDEGHVFSFTLFNDTY
jgi:hypothetical protein